MWAARKGWRMVAESQTSKWLSKGQRTKEPEVAEDRTGIRIKWAGLGESSGSRRRFCRGGTKCSKEEDGVAHHLKPKS